MLNECLGYLEERIRAVMGKNVLFYTRLADLRVCASSQVASAVPDTDISVFSGAVVRNTVTGADDLQLLERTITVHVVLGDRKSAALEPLYERFLALLDRGFSHEGHYISITLGEAGWVDEKDSLLKAQIAVELPVIFCGGVYRAARMGQIEQIEIIREDQNEQ